MLAALQRDSGEKRRSKMNKSKVLTVALIVVLAGLAVCAWSMFGTTAAGLEYANADKYTVGDATVTGAVENLDVDWTAGKVNIEYHNGEGVLVSEKANQTLNEDDKLRWWLDGTTLHIRYAKSGFRISFNLDKELTVSLPAGTVLKTADISSTSGDLNLPGLAADEIRLGSTSGSISAVTVTNKLTATSTSGSIAVRQGDTIGAVDLGSTSGSISCTLGANAASVTAGSTSGSISLSVAGSVETVKLGSTSGRIYPELASVGTVEIATTSGGVEGSFSAFKDVDIGTTSGKVTLKLGTDPGFTCKIGSVSGDFTTGLSLTKNGDTYTCGDGSGRIRIGTTSGDITLEKE